MHSDKYAQPRDPSTAIHALMGEWEYQKVPIEGEVDGDWAIVAITGEYLLLRKYYYQRCGCGLEWGHDTDIMWVL